MQLAFI